MTPGKRTRTGVLHLRFERQGGRTVLTCDLQKAPLMIVRPFALPCGTLAAYMINPTGGLLGGDHAEVRVHVAQGARVALFTQAAARLQPAPNGTPITQDMIFELEDGARLDYHPQRTIPFADSHFVQRIEVRLTPDAQLALTETWAAGRVAMGEAFAFARYASRVEVRVAGVLTYLDAFDLRPGQHGLSAPGVLGASLYCASGIFFGGARPDTLPSEPGILACGLTATSAVWLRAASASGPDLDAHLLRARESLRMQMFESVPLRERR